MPADRTFWPVPHAADLNALYLWGRRLGDLMRAGKHVEILSGSVTLTAGTSTSVPLTDILSGSKVLLTATSAAARTLGVPAVTAKTQGTGFTLTHAAAAGTETYDYVVYK